MMQRIARLALTFALLTAVAGAAQALDSVEEYIREYPNQEQTKMMNAWLTKHEKGTLNETASR